MESPIYTFLPATASLYSGLWLGLGLGLTSLGLALVLVLRPQWLRSAEARKILPLLLAFLGLLGVASAAFNLVALQKLEPLALYRTHLKIGSTIIPYSQLEQVQIQPQTQRNFLQQEQTIPGGGILVISALRDRNWQLSAAYYPVGAIYQRLAALVRKKND